MARAIRPIHTPFDGDTVFALATGKKKLPEQRPLALTALGSIAADTLTRAIGRALWAAESARAACELSGDVPALARIRGQSGQRKCRPSVISSQTKAGESQDAQFLPSSRHARARNRLSEPSM